MNRPDFFERENTRREPISVDELDDGFCLPDVEVLRRRLLKEAMEGDGLALIFSIQRIEEKLDSLAAQAAPTEPPTMKQNKRVDLRLKKPGRPPDALYDEAYRQLKGKDAAEVFKWFCEKANYPDPGKETRDAFKAALKRRQNKS